MKVNFGAIVEYIPYLLGGILVTLEIAIAAALLGSLLALVFSLLSRKKGILQTVIKVFIDFFRGTPLLFQLAFFHFGIPQITGIIPTPYIS